MPTLSGTVTKGDYTLFTESVKVILINPSSYPIRVHFGLSKPDVDTEDYIYLDNGRLIGKDDLLPLGNTYIRADDLPAKVVAVVEE